MRCWVRITGRWSVPIAIRPTRICRLDAGKSAGLICGAPSRSSWPGAERPSASVTTCCSEQLFTWWHQVRDGTLSRARFQDHIDDLCLRFRFHLCYGQRFADAKTAATCANLLDLGPALWTFARRSGVEPTNNEAERALRHGVLWRHTSFGTHSAEGSRFVERLLTVRDTLRQQQRNVLDYLRMACQAAVSQRQRPRCCLQPTPPFVNISPQPFRPPAPTFLKVILHPELIELGRQLNGVSDIYLRNGGINEQAPNRSVWWHRDGGPGWAEFMHYFSGASRANGCLRIVPGSHTGPPTSLEGKVARLRDERGTPVSPNEDGWEDVELDEEISLEVEPHQMIVRHAWLLHSTWLNRTSDCRYMSHWLFHPHTIDNHRFTWGDYLTQELLDALSPEQREVLWLDREFEVDPAYDQERSRELGRVKWGVV